MYSAPAAFAASITLICCSADFGLWPVTINTRFAPASAFCKPARSSSSATAVLVSAPSTSFALSALRTMQTGFSPKPLSSLTTARPVFPVAPTTAYMALLPCSSFCLVCLADLDPVDELAERGKLLLDQVDRGLILQRTVGELVRRHVDDHLGLAEQLRVDRLHDHAEVILHARTAQEAGRRRLDADRLVLDRNLLVAGDPVDGVLQTARDRPIVLRRHDQHAVGGLDRVIQGIDLLRKTGGLLIVEIVDREFRERRRFLDRHAGGGEPDRGVHELPVERAFTQRAAHRQNVRHCLSCRLVWS